MHLQYSRAFQHLGAIRISVPSTLRAGFTDGVRNTLVARTHSVVLSSEASCELVASIRFTFHQVKFIVQAFSQTFDLPAVHLFFQL